MSIHSNSAGGPRRMEQAVIQAFYCGTDDCPFEAQDKRLASLALSHLASKLEGVGVAVKQNQLEEQILV